MGAKAKDYAGIRRGKLILLMPLEKQTQGKGTIWLAKCDCGTFRKVIGKVVAQGRLKSCGKCTLVSKDVESPRIRRLIRASMRGAKERKLAWELPELLATELLTSRCYYCGGAGGGIDRIDNAVGYLPENSVPCCWPCNKMKGTLSAVLFIKQIRKIYANSPQV